jgi:prepilin-type N-terminal cleavage/methylation domain-containing protein
MKILFRPAVRSSRLETQYGFTLIELMIAMVVSSIVVLGVFAFSSIQQTTASLHERNVRIQQALEGAMWTIDQDIRDAGSGFARRCTELRVWDATSGRLINPGAPELPQAAYVDPMTDESYWVLRDGFQAYWNSTDASNMQGALGSSATPDSAADAFDVIVADSTYVQADGVFALVSGIDAAADALVVSTSHLLDNGNPEHLAQVQQLFPPGTFVAVARAGGPGILRLRPEAQGQCLLLQITDDVQPDPGAGNQWLLPIGTLSGFNADLGAMLEDTNGAVMTCPAETPGCDDWDPGTRDAQAGANVIPLGRLRWSRYEVDYTAPTMPYLVRYDIIGYREGIDPGNLGGVDYPHCNAGDCPAPQLHLPGSSNPPAAVAIGPMIEDMQVAVGCDGYTIEGAANAMPPRPPPDPGFEELGPSGGPMPNVPNRVVDENAFGDGRNVDEWLGNAIGENTAPDCVWYGTAEYNMEAWQAFEGSASPPPAFRMSPQTIRITLTGTIETTEAAGGFAREDLVPVEDRPAMQSVVGRRMRYTLTERFTPKNLRWQDPSVI